MQFLTEYLKIWQGKNTDFSTLIIDKVHNVERLKLLLYNILKIGSFKYYASKMQI